ncbi:MAG: hypothetical protein ACRENJ_05420, partial [Candidatus Eiseniibacteriota bacterium]
MRRSFTILSVLALTFPVAIDAPIDSAGPAGPATRLSVAGGVGSYALIARDCEALTATTGSPDQTHPGSVGGAPPPVKLRPPSVEKAYPRYCGPAASFHATRTWSPHAAIDGPDCLDCGVCVVKVPAPAAALTRTFAGTVAAAWVAKRRAVTSSSYDGRARSSFTGAGRRVANGGGGSPRRLAARAAAAHRAASSMRCLALWDMSSTARALLSRRRFAYPALVWPGP